MRRGQETRYTGRNSLGPTLSGTDDKSRKLHRAMKSAMELVWGKRPNQSSGVWGPAEQTPPDWLWSTEPCGFPGGQRGGGPGTAADDSGQSGCEPGKETLPHADTPASVALQRGSPVDQLCDLEQGP